MPGGALLAQAPPNAPDSSPEAADPEWRTGSCRRRCAQPRPGARGGDCTETEGAVAVAVRTSVLGDLVGGLWSNRPCALKTQTGTRRRGDSREEPGQQEEREEPERVLPGTWEAAAFQTSCPQLETHSRGRSPPCGQSLQLPRRGSPGRDGGSAAATGRAVGTTDLQEDHGPVSLS